MLPMGNMETVIFYTTFIPMGVMHLHARMYFTLTDITSISIGAMYLHARMFCTLTMHAFYTNLLNVFTFKNILYTRSYGAMYLHERSF